MSFLGATGTPYFGFSGFKARMGSALFAFLLKHL